MSSSQSVVGLFLDSPPEWPGRRRARGPRTRTAVVVSIAAHALFIAAAGRMVWTRLEPPPRSPTDFIWLGERLPLVSVVPAEPLVVPVEPPAVEPEQAPAEPAAPLSPPAVAIDEAPSSSAVTQPGDAPAAAGDSLEQRGSRGTDWGEERRRAIAAALAAQARATDFSAFAADDRLEALPAPPEPRPARSIFDSQSKGGGGPSLLQPGQARTKRGRRFLEFCNALTGGGFSLFGFATLCGSAPEYEPSGLFPEVMPEWLKRMPECTETRPLGPLLGESTEFPTIKCRMVRVEGEEP